jgi:hypothetical protein
MIFTSILVGAGVAAATAATIVSLGFTVASMAYQQSRMRKLKNEMDKRKQVNVAVDGEPFYLPVIYGKAKVSGGKVKHLLKNSYVHVTDPASATIFNQGLTASITGSKSEFLFVQQAICYGEIESVVDITVDDKNWNDDSLKYGQRIHVYRTGGTADTMATANGIPATNTFSNTTYASMCFRLNREEYNYNGSPNVSFFVKGNKIRSITYNSGTGVYSLSLTKTYSNNPALVLLDYLTNPVYGKGLSSSFIDLKSFYNAMIICDRVLPSTYAQDGRVNGRRPDVEKEDGTITVQPALPKVQLKLYECNVVLDTERAIRENIELILESMEEAELIWSGGQYFLRLDAPQNLTEQNALVVATITEDDIIRGKMELEFPDSSVRYNQCVARFMNEYENFVDDTVIWPTAYSTTYNQYLLEDSGILLKTEVYLPCTSDPYRALAKAEQMVRTSRREMRAKFSIAKKGLLLEPGDIVSITDGPSNLSNEIMKIESIRMNGDLTADIEARQYSFETIAWNVPDNVPYISNKIDYFYGITPPLSLQFIRDTSSNTISLGKLIWSFPNDVSVDSYQVEYSTDNIVWQILATVKTEFYEINTLTTGSYYFRVRSISTTNSLSNPTSIGPINFSRIPNAPYNLTINEELYYTNVTAGVKSKLNLSWQTVTGASEVSILNYLVETKKTSDTTWTVVGETYLSSASIPDIERNVSYDFRITSVSYYGDKSDSLFISGFVSTAFVPPPAIPSGLSLSSSGEGLSTLSWNLATDLDVLHGGAVSIRHSPLIGASATWETSSDLVEELSGNTTSKTVPTLQGTYFIKFKDSSGTYSIDPAILVNTFVDTNFNFIGAFPQEPTFSGTKVGFSVTAGIMSTSVGFSQSSYEFAAIDLGEIASVRLIPSINAAIFDRSDLFCNIPIVCNSLNICGASVSGSVKFSIQTSDNGVNYTPWELFITGNYKARYIKIKVEMDSGNTNTFFEVYNLGIEIDTKDRVYKGKVTTSATASTTVTFPSGGFYAGLLGTTSPSVGLQIINAQEGDTPIITSRTKTAFTFGVWNAGSRVVREIDWQAIGQ